MKDLPLLFIAFLMTCMTLPAIVIHAKETPPESASQSSEDNAESATAGSAEKSTEYLEEELDESNTESLEQEISENPLNPPNTSSPRATLKGFIESMNLSYVVLMEAHKENLQTPGLLVSEPVGKRVQLAEVLISRSVDYLDLSKVAEEFREKVGQEHALMLKEILDRIEVPSFSEIPGIKAIEKEEEEEKISELDRWRIPNTDIVVAEVEEGPQKGKYLFSPQTVERLEEFYNKAAHIPYKEDKEISRHFYDFFISTPGKLLPPKWGKWLPAWSTQQVFGQTIWQWLALLSIPIAALLAIWKVVRVWLAKSAELSATFKVTGWIIIVFFNVVAVMGINYLLDAHVNISGSTLVFVESILTKLFIICLPVFVIWEALKSSISPQVPEEETDEEGGDDEWGARSLSRGDTLLVMLRKFLLIIIFTIVCFLLLSAMGINIGPLLAGAGVIGIAVGFGSQKLVSDVLSGVFFLADDAFRVGEYIQAGGVSGTVEAITLRNVMLRHHRGMLQIVPYSELVSITNFMRGGMIVKFNIELPYDTDIDKVRKIIKKVGIQMLEDPEIGPDFIRPVKSQGVRSIGDSVMVIRIKFTAKPGKHFLIRREAYRRITEALTAKGIYYAHRKVIVEMPEAEPQESTTDSDPAKSVNGLAGAAAGLENIVRKEKQQISQNKEDNRLI